VLKKGDECSDEACLPPFDKLRVTALFVMLSFSKHDDEEMKMLCRDVGRF